jgi:hypothetical protein
MLRTSILAGAALALFTAPAFAGHSTRAEREATRQLNLEQARLGAVNNPEPKIAVNDMSRPGATPPSAAPTTKVDTGAAVAAQTAMPLSQVNNPSSKIAVANVLNADGKTIGAVQKVELAPNGNPTKVDVALIGKQEKILQLDARNVIYDPVGNTITAKDIS